MKILPPRQDPNFLEIAKLAKICGCQYGDIVSAAKVFDYTIVGGFIHFKGGFKDEFVTEVRLIASMNAGAKERRQAANAPR